jgi:hypothetical protein
LAWRPLAPCLNVEAWRAFGGPTTMTDEPTLHRMTKRKGYRIEKSADGYTLINNQTNTIMYHYKDVTLQEIAKFLTPSDE